MPPHVVYFGFRFELHFFVAQSEMRWTTLNHCALEFLLMLELVVDILKHRIYYTEVPADYFVPGSFPRQLLFWFQLLPAFVAVPVGLESIRVEANFLSVWIHGFGRFFPSSLPRDFAWMMKNIRKRL